MLEDTIERPGRHVYTELSSDRDGSRFNRVLELPVAALRADVPPAVLLEHAYDFTDFHREVASLPRCITVKLRGRAEATANGAEGAQFISARGAQPQAHHGPLQRLLAGTGASPPRKPSCDYETQGQRTAENRGLREI